MQLPGAGLLGGKKSFAAFVEKVTVKCYIIIVKKKRLYHEECYLF